MKGNSNINSFQKIASTSNSGFKNNDDENSGEKWLEKNLVSDFGYNCNYYNGKIHLARDCMLKKKDEK